MTSMKQPMRRLCFYAALFWQTLLSHAYISPGHSNVKKLYSSFSSTPFPPATPKTKRQTQQVHYYNNNNATDHSVSDDADDYLAGKSTRQSPLPTMPSPLFADLALSQFELLSNSLVHTPSSMALYLPKENQNTGQLEFVPAVTYPSSERVFIASDSSNSGIHQPPILPSTSVLGLPGFWKARDLIPSYPFVSSSELDDDSTEDAEMFASVSPDSSISVSEADEIPSPDGSGSTSLSITLFSGLDTLGVLVIWPYKSSDESQNEWKWTHNDKLQVTRAAKSLALALSMDNDRTSTQLANDQFRVALADSLHQVKSPLQALRTFGKLLQRQLAGENTDGRPMMERVPSRRQQQALKLAEDMITQGDRVIDLIQPMDYLVQNGGPGPYLLRGDIKEPSPGAQMGDDGMDQLLSLPPSTPSNVLGEEKFNMVFPQDILGPTVYTYQAISRENGINFDVIGFEPDNLDLPGVIVRQKSLIEAVANLLDNAIKYAPIRRKGKVGRPRTPQIKVSIVSNEPPVAPGCTLYLEDNGPGIPKSEQEKVFTRGYRGEEVKDQVDGTGLGLAIAKEMIARMGGSLDILSAGPNKLDGTTLRIILFRDPEL